MFTKNCIVPIYLAYLMAIYLMGSVFYLIMTKDIGTPFRDSLNEEQLKIKKREANKRRNIFFQGVILSGIILVLVEPFKKCTDDMKQTNLR